MTILLVFLLGYAIGSAFYISERRAHRQSLGHWRETIEEFDRFRRDVIDALDTLDVPEEAS